MNKEFLSNGLLECSKIDKLIRESEIIKKLNKLPGKFKWEFTRKFGFFTYELKLVGDNFYEQRVIEIGFNTANLESSIQFYYVKRTVGGDIKVPIEVDFQVFVVVSGFIVTLIDEFNINRIKDKKAIYPEVIQKAFDLFGTNFVKIT